MEEPAATQRPKTTMTASNGKNGSGTIVSWVAIAFAIISAFLTVANPRGDVKDAKAEMREDLRHSEEQTEKQFEQLKHAIAERETLAQHAEFASRMTDQANTFRDDIRAIRLDLVPRSEHQQHWNEVNDRIATVRDSVADVRKDVQAIAPPADRFKSLEAQIVVLQNRLDMLSRGQGSVQIQGIPKN